MVDSSGYSSAADAVGGGAGLLDRDKSVSRVNSVCTYMYYVGNIVNVVFFCSDITAYIQG